MLLQLGEAECWACTWGNQSGEWRAPVTEENWFTQREVPEGLAFQSPSEVPNKGMELCLKAMELTDILLGLRDQDLLCCFGFPG